MQITSPGEKMSHIFRNSQSSKKNRKTRRLILKLQTNKNQTKKKDLKPNEKRITENREFVFDGDNTCKVYCLSIALAPQRTFKYFTYFPESERSVNRTLSVDLSLHSSLHSNDKLVINYRKSMKLHKLHTVCENITPFSCKVWTKRTSFRDSHSQVSPPQPFPKYKQGVPNKLMIVIFWGGFPDLLPDVSQVVDCFPDNREWRKSITPKKLDKYRTIKKARTTTDFEEILINS